MPVTFAKIKVVDLETAFIVVTGKESGVEEYTLYSWNFMFPGKPVSNTFFQFGIFYLYAAAIPFIFTSELLEWPLEEQLVLP